MKKIKCARAVAFRNFFHAGLTSLLGKGQFSPSIPRFHPVASRCEHPDQANVATQKNRPKRIGGLPFFEAKNLRSKTDSKLRNVNAKFFCRNHMATFVKCNRDQQPHDDDENTDNSHENPLSFHSHDVRTSRSLGPLLGAKNIVQRRLIDALMLGQNFLKKIHN